MEGKKMLIPTVVLGLVAGVLVLVVYIKGGDAMGSVSKGVLATAKILPILVFALIGAATLGQLIPKDWIVGWIGSGSGFRGILVGSVAGIICPSVGCIAH